MDRKRNKLRHRAEGCIQIVELVRLTARPTDQSRKAVERAIDSPVVGEVQNDSTPAGNRYEIEPVFIRMHASDARASVDMRQVDPLGALTRVQLGAGGGAARQLALEEVDGSGVKVSRRAVGNRRNLQIVKRLLSAATERVAAGRDAGFVDLRPGTSTVGRAPDSLISV